MKTITDVLGESRIAFWKVILLSFSICVFAFVTEALWALLLLPLITFMPVVARKKEIIFILMVWTFGANLHIPFTPDKLTVFDILTAFYIGIRVVNICSSKVFRKLDRFDMHILFIIVVTLLLAIFRGIGLEILGSSKWGGARYLLVWMGCVLFLFLRDERLKVKEWLYAFLGMGIFAMLQSLFLWLFFVFRMDFLSELISFYRSGYSYPDLQVTSQLSMIDLMRFEIGVVSSIFGFISSCALWSMGRVILSFVMCILSLFLGCWSGHRITLIYAFIIYTLYWITGGRDKWYKRILNLSVFFAVFLIYVTLNFIALKLPLPWQRTISWIPGIEINPEAKEDAEATLKWRLNVWKYALIEEAPKYLIFGKGIAFSADDILKFTQMSLDDPAHIAVTRLYHHGLLSVLIETGLPAFLPLLFFIVGFVKRHIIFMYSNWNDIILKNLHRALFVSYVACNFIELALSGGIEKLLNILFLAGLTESVRVSDIYLLNERDT